MEPSASGVQDQPVTVARERSPEVSPSGKPRSVVSPQACSTCGPSTPINGNTADPSWVYALGTIQPRFPSISVEKEFAQAIGRDKTVGLTDRQALHSALVKPENRYLVRQLCWVMSVQGLETYLLSPRDPGDFSLLVETIRPNPSPQDLDCVVGIKGPIAPQEACNGLMVPIVIFDQIYSFDREGLIKSIPRPDKVSAKDFGPAAEEVFDRIIRMTDNAGNSEEHRALNYLALRYPATYAKAAEQFASNASLTAVDVRPSVLSSTRKLLDVVFSYTNRTTDVVEMFSVRVDVTDEFPFLVTKLASYYGR